MAIFEKFKKKEEEVPVKKEVGYERAYNYLLNGVEALYMRGILQKYGLSDQHAKQLADSAINFKASNANPANEKEAMQRKYYNLAAGTMRLYTNQILQRYGIPEDDALEIISTAGDFSKADLQHLEDSYIDGKNKETQMKK